MFVRAVPHITSAKLVRKARRQLVDWDHGVLLVGLRSLAYHWDPVGFMRILFATYWGFPTAQLRANAVSMLVDMVSGHQAGQQIEDVTNLLFYTLCGKSGDGIAAAFFEHCLA